MNSGLYRLVFNALRGVLVAVEEHARTHSGGKPARVRNPPRATACETENPHSPWLAARVLAFAALCAFGMQPLVVNAQATLPITPDKSGSSHPVVTVSTPGVPVVDIVAPGSSGVSNNRFTQYNVGTSGVVIANNGQAAQTQIAGWVQANPFIGNNPARLVLLQVTAPNPSRLLGPTEIAGRAAPLILANPAGITCNGCGFLGIPRVTLTTGSPTFNADGSLTGSNVTQGQISVDTGGLFAQGAPIDLIARAMTVNGQIWAQSVNAVAGANQVDYATDTPTPQAGSGASPQFAIDVQALGSMYANSVRLVGTEAGVGVRDAGAITSLTGDINVSSNGDVTIDAPGRMQSAGNTQIAAPNVTNAGNVFSTGMLGVNAAGTILNSGILAAGSDAALTAQTVANSGQIGAGVNANATPDSNVVKAGDLSVNAATLVNSGQLHAGANAALTITNATLDTGRVSAANVVTVKAAQNVSNRNGTLTAGGALTVNAQNFDGTGEIASSGASARFNVVGDLANDQGSITARDDVQANSGELSNQNGTIGTVSGPVTVTTGALNNERGKLLASGALVLDTSSLDNALGTLSSGTDPTVRNAGACPTRAGP